jgi:hypothetical protein
MIRYKIEAELDAGDVGVALDGVAAFFERLREIRRAGRRVEREEKASRYLKSMKTAPKTADAPTVAPDAPWTVTETGVPDSGAPALDKATEAQLAEGADVWMGVLMQWQSGFGDETAEQPNRLKILSEAVMECGGPMFACLQHYGGLTRMVRSFLATTPKRKARRIAENLAQVSSAAGSPVISDHLEFTREYMSKEYKNAQFSD